MTYQQLLAHIRQITKDQKIKWRITKTEQIRCRRGTCPLGLLTTRSGDDYWTRPWPGDAADELDTLDSVTMRMADAADFKDTHYPSVRRDLLRACGLKEKE